MAIALGKSDDGRFVIVVEAQPAKAGEAGHVFRTWQTSKGGPFWGAKAGVRTAGWQSLGKPGG